MISPVFAADGVGWVAGAELRLFGAVRGSALFCLLRRIGKEFE